MLMLGSGWVGVDVCLGIWVGVGGQRPHGSPGGGDLIALVLVSVMMSLLNQQC